jgi:hypothetical protein
MPIKPWLQCCVARVLMQVMAGRQGTALNGRTIERVAAMEHRYNCRHTVNMKVLIYKGGIPIAVGWLRNVCRQGLFIVSDSKDVSINQPLEIELLGDRANADSHRRCRAMVAHKADDGYGLAVDEECATSGPLLDEVIVKCRQREAAFSALLGLNDTSTDSFGARA